MRVFKENQTVKQTIRKVVTAVALLLFTGSFGQFHENVFAEDHASSHTGWSAPDPEPTTYQYDDGDDEGPPNPADPVPIDGYLPLLFLFALLILAKKNISAVKARTGQQITEDPGQTVFSTDSAAFPREGEGVGRG